MTVGSRLSIGYYYSRIQSVLHDMHLSCETVLPCNRAIVDAFMQRNAGINRPLHRFLAAAYDTAHNIQMSAQSEFDLELRRGVV